MRTGDPIAIDRSAASFLTWEAPQKRETPNAEPRTASGGPRESEDSRTATPATAHERDILACSSESKRRQPLLPRHSHPMAQGKTGGPPLHAYRVTSGSPEAG